MWQYSPLQLSAWCFGYRDTFFIITTHTTFISADFQATLARLNSPSLIIADEAHHLGAA